MDPGSGGGGGGGGGGSSSSSDSAPDCWDQTDMEAPGPGPCGGGSIASVAEAQRENLSAAFSRQLNVNAKPFVPNVHAAEFVPSFLRGPAQPPPSPAGAAGGDHGAGSSAGGPSGKLWGWVSPRHGRRARARVPWWGRWRGRAAGQAGTWGADSGAGSSGWGASSLSVALLGAPGREEQRPGDPAGLPLRRRPPFTPKHRNRMGPASQRHEAHKWGRMGPEVRQVYGVRA